MTKDIRPALDCRAVSINPDHLISLGLAKRDLQHALKRLPIAEETLRIAQENLDFLREEIARLEREVGQP